MKYGRCFVPLRVPMCTLTEVLWHIHYRDELEDMRLPQRAGLHAVDCGVIYLYPRRDNFKLCEPSVPEFASRGKRRIASSPAPSLSLLM